MQGNFRLSLRLKVRPDLGPLHPLLQVCHQPGHVLIRLSVSTFQFLSNNRHMVQHAVWHHLRRADGAGSYRSSTFFHSLLLQLLDGLQQASVVGDAVHSGVLLVLFGVHVPQQLCDVDVLLLLWTLLLGWRPESFGN